MHPRCPQLKRENNFPQKGNSLVSTIHFSYEHTVVPRRRFQVVQRFHSRGSGF